MGILNDAEKYINFYTDYGFKRLFGSEPSKNLLMDFLNALMEQENKGTITSLTYLKNEQMGDYELDRKSIYDIYCETDRGERFLIELQKIKQKYFKDRMIYYAAVAMREQQKRSDWSFRLMPVYVVAIMDFVLDDIPPCPGQYRHDVALREAGAVEPFSDKLFFIFLEMPKFTKKSSELTTHFEKWMYAIKNMNLLDDIPGELREQVFEEFFKAAEIARLSPVDQESYERSRKTYLDLVNTYATLEERGLVRGMEQGMAQGMAKGLEEGMAKGQEKGEKKKAYDVALKMLALNMPLEAVQTVSGLSPDVIKQLNTEK